MSKKSNTEQLTALVVEMCRDNNELTAAILTALVELVENGTKSDNEPIVESQKPARKHAAKPAATDSEPEWYDMFRSEHTTVTVKSSTVQVAVERGHASEWKAQLRAAGFRWSKNARCYWAWLDDEKRAEIARRNAENDAATEGMTAEERRAYWAERRAACKTA